MDNRRMDTFEHSENQDVEWMISSENKDSVERANEIWKYKSGHIYSGHCIITFWTAYIKSL
jgi:hypothetical protein